MMTATPEHERCFFLAPEGDLAIEADVSIATKEFDPKVDVGFERT